MVTRTTGLGEAYAPKAVGIDGQVPQRLATNRSQGEDSPFPVARWREGRKKRSARVIPPPGTSAPFKQITPAPKIFALIAQSVAALQGSKPPQPPLPWKGGRIVSNPEATRRANRTP